MQGLNTYMKCFHSSSKDMSRKPMTWLTIPEAGTKDEFEQVKKANHRQFILLHACIPSTPVTTRSINFRYCLGFILIWISWVTGWLGDFEFLVVWPKWFFHPFTIPKICGMQTRKEPFLWLRTPNHMVSPLQFDNTTQGYPSQVKDLLKLYASICHILPWEKAHHLQKWEGALAWPGGPVPKSGGKAKAVKADKAAKVEGWPVGGLDHDILESRWNIGRIICWYFTVYKERQIYKRHILYILAGYIYIYIFIIRYTVFHICAYWNEFWNVFPPNRSLARLLWGDILCPPATAATLPDEQFTLQAPQRPFKVGERVRYWLPDYKMGVWWM